MSTNDNNSNNSTTLDIINNYDIPIHNNNYCNGIDKFPIANDTDSYSSKSSVPLANQEYKIESLNSFGKIDNVFKGKGKEIILDINETCFKLQINTMNFVKDDKNEKNNKTYNSIIHDSNLTHFDIDSTLNQPFSSNSPSYDIYEVLREIKDNTLISYPHYRERHSNKVHPQQQKIEINETYMNSYITNKKNTSRFSTSGTSTIVIAKYMFWIGWLIMPTWWIGSFYLPQPTSNASPDDYKWRKRCRNASTWGLIGLILGGLFFVIVKSRNNVT